jgi:two-component system sensor histidine kinase PhoQ
VGVVTVSHFAIKPDMMSLRARLILAASLVLTIFIMIAGYTLDRAFYNSAEKNLQENLETQLTLLMSSMELESADNIDMPPRLLETKFSLPSSGLYAIIVNDKGKTLWKSLSTVGVAIPAPRVLKSGEQKLVRVMLGREEFYIKSYGISWYTETGKLPMTFNVITDLAPFNLQISSYRKTLWGWLIGLAGVLLTAQVIILIWGLKPLRNVIGELNAIENGKQERITRKYPKEILRLTDNINGLLEHEHAQQQRYRDGLADLAHSLKTPLAVMNGAISDLDASSARASLSEQLQRMDHIVAHQLQRAAMAGASPVRKSLAVEPITSKLTSALSKVYKDKNIIFDIHMPKDLQVRVDEGDIMEVLGNLLDNACKWCMQRVRINVTVRNNKALFVISDDGPGIAESKINLILQRGGRADQAKPGQGIGLAIVADIINAYKGELSITRSDLGGAAFSFDLPASK